MAARILVFLSIILSIVAGVHFYFWTRLVRDTRIPLPYRAWASAAIVLLALIIPACFIAMRALPVSLNRLVAWPGFVWMGTMFLLFTTLLTADLVRAFLLLGAKATAADLSDPERRTLLARVLGIAAGSIAGVTGLVALANGLRQARVKQVEVTLSRLPKRSDGTTIVQLTDVHVGPTIGRAMIEDLVAKTNALDPDIIAITGDLVDGSVEDLAHAVAPLKGLRARHGVFFVTGNHEFFSGADAWMAALRSMGIRVLANERVSIGGVGPDEGFDLAGVHDFSAQRFGAAAGPDLAGALVGRDASRELVLLAHQPKAVTEAAANDVGLQLSGHTHGGQIWPFTFLVGLQQPYVQGLHTHQGTRTQIYVSPGTGYWGPPMRLRTAAEITKITLRSAAARTA